MQEHMKMMQETMGKMQAMKPRDGSCRLRRADGSSASMSYPPFDGSLSKGRPVSAGWRNRPGQMFHVEHIATRGP